MIDIIYKSKRSNLYELQIRAIISQLQNCHGIIEAKNYFHNDIQRLPRLSVGEPKDFYSVKSESITEQSFEIWHKKANGDFDRLVAIIKEKHS